MKDPNLSEQKDADARSFALVDFRPQDHEQRFDVSPTDRSAYRAGENPPECSLMFTLHTNMVLYYGTTIKVPSGGAFNTRRR